MISEVNYLPHTTLLKYDVDLLHITKELVEVELDSDWEGFTTYRGNIEEIGRDKSTKYLHLLRQGRYWYLHTQRSQSHCIKIKPLSVKVEDVQSICSRKHIAKKTSRYITLIIEKNHRVMGFALACSSIILYCGIYSWAYESQSDDTP